MRFDTLSTHTLAHRNHDFGLASSRPGYIIGHFIVKLGGPLPGRQPDALDPGFTGFGPLPHAVKPEFHGVGTHWIRGFMAFWAGPARTDSDAGGASVSQWRGRPGDRAWPSQLSSGGLSSAAVAQAM